jgi:prophage regulatory protein
MTPKQKPPDPAPPVEPQPRRFLPLKAVEDRTGLKHAAIYEKMSRGEFPRPVKLSNNPKARKHSVRWLEDEITAWQEARIAERDATAPPKPYRPRRGDREVERI